MSKKRKKQSMLHVMLVLFTTQLSKLFACLCNRLLGSCLLMLELCGFRQEYYAWTLRGRSRTMETDEREWLSAGYVLPVAGQGRQVIYWCAALQKFISKDGFLATFIAGMLILHSVLSSMYLCKTSGILFNSVLTIFKEASSWNFGITPPIDEGMTTADKRSWYRTRMVHLPKLP